MKKQSKRKKKEKGGVYDISNKTYLSEEDELNYGLKLDMTSFLFFSFSPLSDVCIFHEGFRAWKIAAITYEKLKTVTDLR